MERIPLIESAIFKPLGTPRLVESVQTPGAQVFEVTGVFQNYIDLNVNRRRYPKHLWENVLKPGSDFHAKLQERSVFGLLEHPDDGITRTRLISHLITEVHIATDQEIAKSGGELREGDIIGTYQIVPEGDGKMLHALHQMKATLGVSSRGSGTVTECGDHVVVNDDFLLETWDVVVNPSVQRAKPRPVFTPATPPPAQVTESVQVPEQPTIKPHAAMSKLQETKQLKTRVLQLTRTAIKGLKPSEKSGLFESIDTLRVEAASFVNEDPTVKPIVENILKALNEYEEELDKPDDMPPPADDVPADDVPADDVPPEDTDTVDPEEVAATLNQAAACLRGECDDTDPETIASELEDLANRIGPVDDEAPVSDEEFEALPESSKRIIRKILKEKRAVEHTANRLQEASRGLLERVRSERRPKLNESKLRGQSINEWAEAADTLASRYNKDMIQLGAKLFETSHPKLFAKYRVKLAESKTWTAFSDQVAKILQGNKVASSRLAEASPRNKPTSTPAPAKPLVESAPTHPALRIVTSARR